MSSLRVRLLVLVLLALVPASGLTLYTALEQRRLLGVEAQDTALRLARLAASDQGRLVSGTRQLLAGLAQLPQVRPRSAKGCSERLRDILAQHPLYANVGAITPDGTLFCSALPTRELINLADRAYFKRVVATADFAIGEYQIGRATGKATINVGYPVLERPGGLQAVVFAAIDLGWLNQFVRQANLPTGSTLTAVDEHGTVLVRYPEGEQWIGRTIRDDQEIGIVLRHRAGVAEAAGADGIERLVGFAPLLEGPGAGNVYVSIAIPSAVAFAAADRSLIRNLIVLFAVGAAALLVGWIWANAFVLRPVDQLVAATRRVAAGNLAPRTGVRRGRGELDQLGRAFDEMTESLARDRAAREEAQQEVARKREALLQQEKLAALGRLAAGVAHELRNPLTVLDGRLELLVRQAADERLPPPDQLGKHFNTLKDATERMKRIMQGLSAYSKPTKPEPARLDVGELLGGVRELVSHQAKTNDVSIVLDVPTPAPAVLGDRSQMMQVLLNLAVNAIEAMTTRGGVLTLRAGVEDRPPGTAAGPASRAVLIEVQDTGAGIPPERLSRIWEAFYTTKPEGTGLGLSIVRTLIADQPGATVDVQSAAGAGTTFRITMPVAGGG